jgi:DNA-cytosine methyltransferase
MNHPLTILDLFSGIGGFSYAAERLVGGFKTIAFCDSDEPCRKVLRKHWPTTPIFTDVCSLTAEQIKPLCPSGLSLITAGFPCQDLSVAGKQAGYDGNRSVLFYEIIRLARELQPQFLLLENVRNLLSHNNGETFQETLFQIAKAGYDAEWAVIPASDLGACHRRERVWIVAHAKKGGDIRLEEQAGTQLQLECMGKTGRPPIVAHSSQLFSDGSEREHARQSGGTSLSQSGNSDWQNASHANNSGSQGQRPQRELPKSSGQMQAAWRSGGSMLSPEWGGLPICPRPLSRR